MKPFRKHIIYAVLLNSIWMLGQNDLASKEDMMIEQQNINFQTFFFEALQQKGIEHYDKAIYALEACLKIDNDNVAVLFELAKNYTFLTKYTEAEFYALKALENEPKNKFVLEHLMEIKSKKNDYAGAIKVQKQLIAIEPERESDLVILYIKAGQIQEAIALLKKLDAKDQLPPSLMSLKASLASSPSEETPRHSAKASESKLSQLKEQYALKNDYQSLKAVLDRELKTKQYLQLLKDSQAGLEMFPAQPYLYLMNGTANNSLRKYQQALEVLELGLDFLVENPDMEVQFYKQMSLAYKGLGENKKATEYYNKSLNTQK